jgi:hypothetical protein
MGVGDWAIGRSGEGDWAMATLKCTRHARTAISCFFATTALKPRDFEQGVRAVR